MRYTKQEKWISFYHSRIHLVLAKSGSHPRMLLLWNVTQALTTLAKIYTGDLHTLHCHCHSILYLSWLTTLVMNSLPQKLYPVHQPNPILIVVIQRLLEQHSSIYQMIQTWLSSYPFLLTIIRFHNKLVSLPDIHWISFTSIIKN